MLRKDIIAAIGEEYYSYSIGSEHGEFLYETEFKARGRDWKSIRISNPFDKKSGFYKNLDLRFVDTNKRISVCVETKIDYKKSQKFFDKAQKQLAAYMDYEKQYSGNIVIGILASTTDDDILMYRDSVSEDNILPFKEIPTMERMVDHVFPSAVNNKENVMSATYKLNEELHSLGIEARIRSQFVGTCLLALKNNLDIETATGQPRTVKSILADMEVILGGLLDGSMDKAEKLTLLSKALKNERIENLPPDSLHEILVKIKAEILPFINDDTMAGQDILNLFFTTFNKYVDKDDKNQAFTPDHITEFMCRITGVNKSSRVLDPCCGSGSFLVRALVMARNDCYPDPDRDELIKSINESQIYGIEYAEKPYGLATTNMLIHSDGNTNIRKASCFEKKKFIQEEAVPTVILMNPPYNAQRVNFPAKIVESTHKVKDKRGKTRKIEILKTYCYEAWPKKDGKPAKEDPTKGLCFVEYISDCLREVKITGAKLAVLLPLACAIGDKGLMLRAKQNLLKYNTLEAVFTMPTDMFHPGATANACCMLFTMGIPHLDNSGNPKKATFFGYYKEDGFKKKKYLGRVEQLRDGQSIWKTEIEPKWIETFEEKKVVDGFSATAKVVAEDEWLCEAFMKTDYSTLTEKDFQQALNNYLAYLVKEGIVYESDNK